MLAAAAALAAGAGTCVSQSDDAAGPRAEVVMPDGRTEPLLPAKEQNGLSSAKRKLLIGTLLCFLFMLAEIVGGLLAHSLAVMTDAAHMLSDVAGCVAHARRK